VGDDDAVVDLLGVSRTERERVLLGVTLLGLQVRVSGERVTERDNVAEVVAVGDKVYDSVPVLDLLAAVAESVPVTHGVTVRVCVGEWLLVEVPEEETLWVRVRDLSDAVLDEKVWVG